MLEILGIAWSSLFFLAALSLGLTGLVRRYALRRLLDVPNARSSHSQPTPRGGGLAILITLGVGLTQFTDQSWGPHSLKGALLGGLPLAVIGFLDDHFGVPARWRFLVQILSAIWVFWALGGTLPPDFMPRWLLMALGVPLLVWLVNLYNFMDGIDGIAGSQALFVFCTAAFLMMTGKENALDAFEGSVALMAGASTLGFLIWNWPPAKIFMGDVGSGPLGFLIGVLALFSSAEGVLALPVWLILNGVFLVDASLTLLIRLARGDRWYEAHRAHAYQHASRIFQSHLSVTRAVSLINVSWLLPLAWCSMNDPRGGWLYLPLAWLPLGLLALRYRAGHPD